MNFEDFVKSKLDEKVYECSSDFEGKEKIPMKFFANDGTEIIPTSPVYKVITYYRDEEWPKMLDDYVREACVYEYIMFRRNDDLWIIPYDYVLVKHDEDIYFDYRLDDLHHYVPLIDERNTVCE